MAVYGKGPSSNSSRQHWSCGGTSLLLTILRHAAQEQRWSALIDGTDSFDPQSAGPEILSSLLWIRCRDATEAIRSADLLLRDGNLPVNFFGLRGKSIPPSCAKFLTRPGIDLQRAIELTSAAMVVLTSRSLGRICARSPHRRRAIRS
jgi:hypothetical protein